MFEILAEIPGFDTLTPRTASILFGLGLGAAFGMLAEQTRFCLRRGLVDQTPDARRALAGWVTALAVAVAGTQAATAAGWITFSQHRFLSPDLPLSAIVIGGLIFGTGMVMTRGCLSRLSVLGASGNLRALVVLGVAAISALATAQGILSPLRTGLSAFTIPAPTLAEWMALLPAALAAGLIFYTRPPIKTLLLTALIGALVPVGWIGTGLVLFDDFDPIPFESLSFTAPLGDTLFWVAASSALPGSFNTGLIAGVFLGAFICAVIAGRFQWQGFHGPRQMGRYLSGGALMGMGGVLAGGCTIGAGLSGVATLSGAAMLTLLSISAGAWAAGRIDARLATPHTKDSNLSDQPQTA